MTGEPKKRILVVDDEQHICKIIDESLSGSDYDVAAFTKPAEAIEYLQGNPVDLVLTDLIMGGSSGLSILEATLQNHPDAIVIIMTAHPTVETAIEVLKKGGYDFLVKPFKLELLGSTIRRGLAHQKVLRDNLSLKGQVDFLKVSNTFLRSGADLDSYLELVLKSCSAELEATASAVMEIDPESGGLLRCLEHADNEADRASVVDERLLAHFRRTRTGQPFIQSESITVDGRKRSRILVSQPILIRRKLHGIINVLTVARSEQVPLGRLDVLSILANSAASAIANQNLYQDVQRSYLQGIAALAKAIEARDKYTAGHTDRVTKMAEPLARRLGWDDAQIFDLHTGCTLHDVGKIGVPDAILNKAGRLTDSERRLMMRHPQLGYQIIKGIDLFKPAIPYILSHHERFDGEGYPKGLKGEEIPIEGRILAVVDTVDAILSDRPYREGASLETAIVELLSHKGRQFDPALVDLFIEVIRCGEIDLVELYGREEDLSCIDRCLRADVNTGITTETEPA